MQMFEYVNNYDYKCACIHTFVNNTLSLMWKTVCFSPPETRNPVSLSVAPLNDVALEVRWDAGAIPSASGFVVEWAAASESSPRPWPHWQKLSSNCSRVNLSGERSPLPVTPSGTTPTSPYQVPQKAQSRRVLIPNNQSLCQLVLLIFTLPTREDGANW